MEVLLLASSFLFFSLWFTYYLQFQDVYWNKIKTPSPMGDNKHLVGILLFLYFFTIFKIFWRKINENYNSQMLKTFYYFVFISFLGVCFSFSKENFYESYIWSLILLFLTVFVVTENCSPYLSHNYTNFFILILAFYFVYWFSEIKNIE